LRKELLPSLLRREVTQALDDPALVILLTKFSKRLPQLLHRPEGAHPKCTAPDFLDTELSLFMQRLLAQGAAAELAAA
jgi:hypothetical protein